MNGEPKSSGKADHLTYDAARAPVAAKWLASDETLRLSAVMRYHQVTVPAARRPPNPIVHANVHVIVENQLATSTPPEAAEALSRLIAEGMPRHDAVHAIGFLVTEHMHRAMGDARQVDVAAYAADLELFSLERWRKLALGGS